MKCTFFLVFLLLGGGPALAANSLTAVQLAQLVKDPAKFSPTTKSSNEVNTGYPVTVWRWGSLLDEQIYLERSPKQMTAWSMRLSKDFYDLSKLFPQRKLLAVINDQMVNVKMYVYAVTGGALKGTYAIDKNYSDGSGALVIATKQFALGTAAKSELVRNGNNMLMSYPLYGVIGARDVMCRQPQVTCR